MRYYNEKAVVSIIMEENRKDASIIMEENGNLPSEYSCFAKYMHRIRVRIFCSGWGSRTYRSCQPKRPESKEELDEESNEAL